MHKSLKELEFEPDPITDFGVTCPLASEKVAQMAKIPHLRNSNTFRFLYMCLLPARIKKDPIKNEGARVFTRYPPL